MTEKTIDAADDDPNAALPCECQDCDWTGKVSELGCQLEDVCDLLERVSPGEIVPVGECPECRGLAHLVIKST